MNSILQQWVQTEEDTARNTQAAPSEIQQTDSANATDTIEDLRKEIKQMREAMQNNQRKQRKDVPPAQGKDDDGNDITYCWSHGITRNLWHNSKTCKRCKEGHKKEATLQNKMGGSEECCKTRRN